ncbi:hypothetical protein, partial [Streptosporangium amethystogenes]|uniref:hypothetical protein n=1 Tax=Streptosporangium amethystogenes TaxID=2002 RepID=UPI001B80C576
MSNPSAPVLDRTTVSNCGCFADTVPMPMGCAVCGHAPYAHGCPDRPADHEYAQPSGALLDIRLRARRTGDRSLPCFEPSTPVTPAETIPSVPAPRSAGQIPAGVSVQCCAEQALADEVGPVADRRPGERASDEMPTPAEKIPPIPVQRRPGQAPPVVPVVPASLSRRSRCRLRSTRPSTARTEASRLSYRRHLASRPRRTTTCALLAPSSYRPPGRYGVPLQILPCSTERARP